MENSLNQYLELIQGNLATIDANAPEALDALRPEAVEALRRFGRLPRRGDEGFPNASPEEMFAPDYGLNITRRPIPADVAASFRCDVPNISTLTAIVVGDSFHPTATLLKNLPEGIEVMSLARAAKEHPTLVSQYLNKLAANSSAPVALNTALLQDGVFIRAARGARLDKAIQIVNIFNTPVAMMAVRRVLIVAEEDSALRVLLCDHSQRADVDYLSSQVVEIFAGKDASVELYDIEESSARTRRLSSVFVRQDSGASFFSTGCALCGGDSIASSRIDLEGAGASASLGALVIASGSRHIDNSVLLTHAAPHCTSRQLFKYALFDDSRGAFGGKVVVRPGAVRTDAAQTNRNLLVGEHSTMHSDPQLEIYCDDVKASHGATTGQLDARALFYMRSRGIPEDEARRMLVQAFMMDVADSIRLDALRDRMRLLVEKRLGGDASASCADCAACK
ncbi:MAG: Fe-S cluster assembly protein SufD [Muribaculaceae bacterium]|nr:Fe-S cluster assembly protein SufD [Muribaculaceae bacterium]